MARRLRALNDTVPGCITFLGRKYADSVIEMLEGVADDSLVYVDRVLRDDAAGAVLKPGVELVFVDNAKGEFFEYARKHYSEPVAPVIGSNCSIHPTAVIYNNVVIGNNCIIKANAVIGGDGFGYDAEGRKLPHSGRVVIGNNVHIGSCTCIDRGTLGDTVIEDDVKIDNLVHIAHNVVLRRGCYVIANAMVAGSCEVGERGWIAPSASIRNGISVGAGAVVGLGAVVSSSVRPDETVLGNPAMEIQEFKLLRKKLKFL